MMHNVIKSAKTDHNHLSPSLSLFITNLIHITNWNGTNSFGWNKSLGTIEFLKYPDITKKTFEKNLGRVENDYTGDHNDRDGVFAPELGFQPKTNGAT